MKIIYVFLLLILQSVAVAQYPNQVRQVVENKVIGSLPYDYSFWLEGTVPNGKDLVEFSVDGKRYYAEANAQGEFEIFVDQPLSRNEVYTYTIDYASKNLGVAGAGATTLKDEFIKGKTMDGTPPPDDNTSNTGNKSSRLAPIAGFGLAYLGTSSNADIDMFGHVGLKGYFTNNVDKRAKNLENSEGQNLAYKKFSDRFGFIVGGAVTPMAYHGKKLDNPILNIKPMVGLTLDVMPEVSLDAGIIFFDYNRSDSSLKTQLDGELRMAWFFTVSLDMDAFTRLRALFNGNPYISNDNETKK